MRVFTSNVVVVVKQQSLSQVFEMTQLLSLSPMTLLIPLLVIICFYLHNRLKRERKSTKKTTQK